MSPKQSKWRWRWRWLLLPLLEGTGASWEDGGGACVSSLSECGAGWRGYRHTDRQGESVSRTSQNKQCPGTRLQGCWKPESFPIFHLSFLSRPQSASASLKLPGASLRVSVFQLLCSMADYSLSFQTFCPLASGTSASRCSPFLHPSFFFSSLFLFPASKC